MGVGAFDDFDFPHASRRRGFSHLRALVAGVGEDRFNERKAFSRLTQNRFRAIAILHAVGMNHDAQQKAERVDEDMALAPGDFLARVIALRVQSRAPF